MECASIERVCSAFMEPTSVKDRPLHWLTCIGGGMSFIKATSTQKMQMCKQLPRMEWQTDEDLWHAVRVCKDASSWYNGARQCGRRLAARNLLCRLSAFNAVEPARFIESIQLDDHRASSIHRSSSRRPSIQLDPSSQLPVALRCF